MNISFSGLFVEDIFIFKIITVKQRGYFLDCLFCFQRGDCKEVVSGQLRSHIWSQHVRGAVSTERSHRRRAQLAAAATATAGGSNM